MMMYSIPRFSQKNYTWLGDAWEGLKNNVRYWWHTPGERDAIAHGEDPEKVKGFWANYRPRWNSFKEGLLGLFAPWYKIARNNYLMKDHDERYGGKLPLGQKEDPEESDYSETSNMATYRIQRMYGIPQQSQMRGPGASQNQNPQQEQPTAKDLQNQQFQLQKQMMQTQRQRQRLLEQERRDRLRTAQMEMKANQEKDKQVDKSTNQSVKTSQQNQKDDMGGGDHVPLYKERTEAIKPKSMR